MRVGDLVEFVNSYGNRSPDIRELGTILRDDHGESDNHCYIVWHTTEFEGGQ